MDLWERHRDDGSASQGTPAEGDNLESLRHDTTRFLNAGDEAITRALSRNSPAFLAANRQRGGQ